MTHDFKHVVLVTGFGPFNNHPVNASWEAVKELEKLCVVSEEMRDVKVVIKEIPVSYEEVAASVPNLWKEHKPTIALHVGVSGNADCLTLESCANGRGYVRLDVNKKCPIETDNEQNILEPGFNVKKICDIINENSNKTECRACISHNAGRYLCEYIYYQSLCIDPAKTLFVHIPDFHKYSSIQTAKGLYDILTYMIKNLRDE